MAKSRRIFGQQCQRTTALVDSKVKERFAGLDVTPHSSSPADFGKLIVNETEKWAKVIREAGIKIEQVGPPVSVLLTEQSVGLLQIERVAARR